MSPACGPLPENSRLFISPESHIQLRTRRSCRLIARSSDCGADGRPRRNPGLFCCRKQHFPFPNLLFLRIIVNPYKTKVWSRFRNFRRTFRTNARQSLRMRYSVFNPTGFDACPKHQRPRRSGSGTFLLWTRVRGGKCGQPCGEKDGCPLFL